MPADGVTRIGLVGAGFIAGQHAGILAGFDDVRLVAVADPVGDRAAALAANHAAQPFVSSEELLDGCAVDALFVCVPPFARGTAELAAVDRGLPFFAEKPLAADLRTAERIAAAVSAAGLPTAVGYHWRYLPATHTAHDLLAERPAHLVLGYWLDATAPPAWWSRLEMSGGQMVEQATHLLDLARYLVGEVAQVYGAEATVARNSPPGSHLPGASAAVLHFAGGALGAFGTTCVLNHKFRAGLQLFCDGLAIELSEFELLAEADYGPPLAEVRSRPEDRAAIRRAAMARQDRDFVDAVRGKPSQVKVPYAEALRSHRLAVAITRSAATGTRVAVDR